MLEILCYAALLKIFAYNVQIMLNIYTYIPMFFCTFMGK